MPINYIREELERLKREGLYRKLRRVEGEQGPTLILDGREVLNLSSNNYLGLANHPALREAAKEAMDRYGCGSGASRLISGNMTLHLELEEKVAALKGTEAALVFNSGYQANIGIVSSLCGRQDAVFSDRLNHASIIDGAILSGSKLFRFSHNDLGRLESILKKERSRFKKGLIITETVFSMDGDKPPLKELADLKDKYDCLLMVDEAHATGIYGKSGSGMVEEYGLVNRVDLIMGTFGKALGGFGAYLASSKSMVDYLINTCRSFIYSTSLPPAIAACDLAAIGLIKEEPHRRKKLLDLARYFRDELKSMGLNVKGDSQIVPVMIGENGKTCEAAKKLQKRGYWILPIRPPTVAAGQARLRFSLTFNHDKEILQRLLKDISDAGI
ncbi:MAG: 8-amino-7-oxononanoate synthase [Candidatus Omnitrophota bacterium]|nr:8-amino-7-oxononanoate synthase [Candidatus Omnitrophota bacterium]